MEKSRGGAASRDGIRRISKVRSAAARRERPQVAAPVVDAVVENGAPGTVLAYANRVEDLAYRS